jgi:hypothetical protein
MLNSTSRIISLFSPSWFPLKEKEEKGKGNDNNSTAGAAGRFVRRTNLKEFSFWKQRKKERIIFFLIVVLPSHDQSLPGD